MNKTYNINLNGSVFTIDEDAYDMLHEYIDTLRNAFSSQPDRAELLCDIEGRIAELISERQSFTGRTVVTLQEIKEIISRIGRPEEIVDFTETIRDESGETTQTTVKEERIRETPPPPPYSDENPRRKLFRNPKDKMLGGVCSGIAAYIGTDATWIRLITIVLCIISFSTVAVVYIILWMIVPEATTPLQRMQMRGQSPTISNIGKTVAGEQPDNDDNAGRGGFSATLTSILNVLVKVILVAIIVISVPVVIALALALFACIIASILLATLESTAWLTDLFPFYSLGVSPTVVTLCATASILVMGVPLAWICWGTLNTMFRPNTSIPKSWRISMLIIWLVAIAAVAVTSHYLIRDTKNAVDTVERVINAADTDSISDDTEGLIENLDKMGDKLEKIGDRIDTATVEVGKNSTTIKIINKTSE